MTIKWLEHVWKLTEESKIQDCFIRSPLAFSFFNKSKWLKSFQKFIEEYFSYFKIILLKTFLRVDLICCSCSEHLIWYQTPCLPQNVCVERGWYFGTMVFMSTTILITTWELGLSFCRPLDSEEIVGFLWITNNDKTYQILFTVKAFNKLERLKSHRMVIFI